jgi:RNA polymerase sigma factor (TIGR02999 family)
MADGQEAGDDPAVDGEITLLLSAAREGDATAMARVCELLYHDLRRIARNRLRAHEPLTLLNTTVLVHESFFRLIKVGRIALADRNHFLRYAARAMRSAVIDVVRQKRTERYGGDLQHVTLDTAMADTLGNREDEVIRLGEAIEQLVAVDDRAMQVVEMRYFAGMTEPEIADALGVTERTVRRDWQKARLLLRAALE